MLVLSYLYSGVKLPVLLLYGFLKFRKKIIFPNISYITRTSFATPGEGIYAMEISNFETIY